MQSIMIFFKSIFGLVIISMLISCTHSIPVSERIYGDNIIKEYEVGSYFIEKEELIFDKERSPVSLKLLDKSTQKKLVAIVNSFKDSEFFLAEKSGIEAIVWDIERDNVRFDLHNCVSFLVAKQNDNNEELIVLEQGILAPCG